MRVPHRPGLDLVTARAPKIFNTAAVAVGGLYLATHSVVVTLIGAGASTVLAWWAIWLPCQHDETSTHDPQSTPL
jgi:hypothetical protein